MPAILTVPALVGLVYFKDSPLPNSFFCDGSALDPVVYPELFQQIGYRHGRRAADNFFHIPDVRGYGIRVPGQGTGIDPDITGRSQQIAGTFTIANCVTTNGSPTVTVPNVNLCAIGQAVSGTGIPGSTFVYGVDKTAGTITLGNATGTATVNATASGTVTLTLGYAASAGYSGSVQSDQYYSHGHSASVSIGPYNQWGDGGYSGLSRHAINPMAGVYYSTSVSVSSSGGNETRMKNKYLNAYIFYA